MASEAESSQERGIFNIEHEYLLRIHGLYRRMDGAAMRLQDGQDPRDAAHVAELAQTICLALSGRLADRELQDIVGRARQVTDNARLATLRSARWLTPEQRQEARTLKRLSALRAYIYGLEVYEMVNRMANHNGLFARRESKPDLKAYGDLRKNLG